MTTRTISQSKHDDVLQDINAIFDELDTKQEVELNNALRRVLNTACEAFEHTGREVDENGVTLFGDADSVGIFHRVCPCGDEDDMWYMPKYTPLSGGGMVHITALTFDEGEVVLLTSRPTYIDDSRTGRTALMPDGPYYKSIHAQCGRLDWGFNFKENRPNTPEEEDIRLAAAALEQEHREDSYWRYNWTDEDLCHDESRVSHALDREEGVSIPGQAMIMGPNNEWVAIGDAEIIATLRWSPDTGIDYSNVETTRDQPTQQGE